MARLDDGCSFLALTGPAAEWHSIAASLHVGLLILAAGCWLQQLQPAEGNAKPTHTTVLHLPPL